jgi:hypothetical protein
MKPKIQPVLCYKGDFSSFAIANNLHYDAAQANRVLAAASWLSLSCAKTSAMYRFTKTDALISGGSISRIFRKPLVDTKSKGDIDVYSNYIRPLTSTLARELRIAYALVGQRTGPQTITLDSKSEVFNMITCSPSGEADIILSTFDFNLVRFAFDVNTGFLYYVPEALEDVRNGTLSEANTYWAEFAKEEFPETYKARLDKYAKMGYYLSLDSFLDSVPLASISTTKTIREAEEDTDEVMYNSLQALSIFIANIKRERDLPESELRRSVSGYFTEPVSSYTIPTMNATLNASAIPSIRLRDNISAPSRWEL